MDGKNMAVSPVAEISWSEVEFRSHGTRRSRQRGWIDPRPAILLGLLCSQTALDSRSGRSGRQGDGDGYGYKSGKGDSKVWQQWTN